MKIIHQFRSFDAPTYPGAAAIDRNSQDPRSEWAHRIPSVKAPKDAQEHLLSNILSIVRVGEQSVTHVIDVGLKLLHQLTASDRVTGEATANERGVGGQDGLFYLDNTWDDARLFQAAAFRLVVRQLA